MNLMVHNLTRGAPPLPNFSTKTNDWLARRLFYTATALAFGNLFISATIISLIGMDVFTLPNGVMYGLSIGNLGTSSPLTIITIGMFRSSPGSDSTKPR